MQKKNISSNKNQKTAPAAGIEKENEYEFPLVKINFMIMAVAGLLLVIGFALMTGGASDDGAFNPEIFSTRRIVVGPLISLIGFVVMGVGIMWKKK